MKIRETVLVAVVGSAAGAATVEATRAALAGGVPVEQPLVYSGRLTEAGAPVHGDRPISLFVWDDATSTDAAHRRCSTIPAAAVPVRDGRFDLALDPSCRSVFEATPDLWIEVAVSGASTGRTKIGAVPFALESARASGATGVLDTRLSAAEARGVPTGAVAFFALSSCPAGWAEYTPARGRYVVGLPASGTLAGTAGTALSNLENRPVGQHNHPVNDPGHTHGVLRASNSNNNNFFQGIGDAGSAPVPTQAALTGIEVGNAGAIAGTNAPYLQLLVCRKD